MKYYLLSNSTKILKLNSNVNFLLIAAFLIFVTPIIARSQSYELFVSSRNTSSVKYFDGATGAFKGDFVSESSGGLSSTQEVAFGLDGHLYVSGRGNTAIKKYNGITGEYIGDFTSGYELDNPTKMTFGPGSILYVSQWGSRENKTKVARFNSVTGVFIDEFTTDLSNGCGHAWDAEGNLYVASFGTSTVPADVKKFDSNGNFIGVFTEAGHLQGAVNLWFDDSGDLLVVDWTLGSVLRFGGTTGAFKSVFISGMTNTEGVAIGPDGLLYFCDWKQNEIVRFNATTGAKVGTFTSAGAMLAPNGLVFAPTTRTIVSVKETHGRLSLNYELQQNYPNPFNPVTLITFSLFESSPVTLNIYDTTGHLVSTLIDENLGEGEYSEVWNGQNMHSGLYFYQLTAGNITETRKMILLK